MQSVFSTSEEIKDLLNVQINFILLNLLLKLKLTFLCYWILKLFSIWKPNEFFQKNKFRSGQFSSGQVRSLNHSLASSRQVLEEGSRNYQCIKVPLWLGKPESSFCPSSCYFIIGFDQIAANGTGKKFSSTYSIDFLA